MKNMVATVIICLTVCACKKSATAIQNEGLIGKWQLTEYFISPGDAGAWHDAEGIHTIEFKTNGAFISSDEAYNGAIGFVQVDSVRIRLVLPTQVTAEIECYFQLQDNNQTLILSPVGCIEGCSNKYKAVQKDNLENL